ncbi:MAG TPA: tetratricopeptide repeat protein [Humisphaera sp.]|jgi:predicted O-linked N-acetylglucosamine transferase (SPINDLY family)|nr:tetratricopeptide repeat protein [Humisphaera sp.]
MNLQTIQAYRTAGRLEDAIAAARDWAAREPGVPSHMELAVCLRDARRHRDALESVDRAIALRPGDAGLYLARGGCLKALGELEGAAQECRRAIELRPTLLPAYNNLGACLHELGRLSDVEGVFRAAMRVLPDAPDVHMNLGWNLYLQGRLPEAIGQLQQTIALAPGWVEANSRLLFVMLHEPSCLPQQIFDEHLAWARRHAEPLSASAAPHANDPDPDRRLRIGYLSTDFRDNSMMFFIEPLLANHDHEQFEITCYADAPDADAVTARTQQYADRWRDITGLSDEQAAAQIREDQIDILVELSGHNGGPLLKIMACKPAPILAGNQGYAHSTGLSAIDYRIVDAYSDPPGMTERWYTEKLIRLSKSNWVYRPPQDAADVAPPPIQRNGYVTFGSFNVLPKITPRVIEIWSRILREVESSRLILKAQGLDDPPTRKRVIDQFARHGIDASRLEILGRTPSRAAHLAAYGQMDIALDPFPYNGTTTTCEALWMGVPVMALAGQTHVSRVGVSLLQNIELGELLADSEDEYVHGAIKLARDENRSARLRSTMRDRMSKSPLRDEPAFAREMEANYRAMWKEWCG